MKQIFTFLALILSATMAFAGKIGDDGFIKIEAIKGDSQYKNASRFDDQENIRGSWTTDDLKELRSLKPGMSKGQVRDALNSESVNYSSGWRGKEWQHAYNYQTGENKAEHHICVVKADFKRGIAEKFTFKHVNTGRIGITPDVCTDPKKPQVIIQEIEYSTKQIRG